MLSHGSPKGKLDKRIVALVDAGRGPGALQLCAPHPLPPRQGRTRRSWWKP